MMTAEQMRNGLMNPAWRWPSKEVPFVIDDVFSEYWRTKLHSCMRGVERNIHAL
jgi:hypothetical protein